ncbi:3-oxoacyl-[acyl-carrier protein] reductase [Nitratireductor aquibiodomus]|uniref:3-oxoacyl-[acyl-carrier protein] reductase n=1 Tax=Nitratireductor aquibiodomus TaxID=204799 RepID=A0A1H4JG02_9HYPH|nr:SDR family oxidoreductase [Nitratireductor aquibiodomus]SEB45077.1 3-oxoacyl-[acyl-carrier protein] reductase [Nitratireductor aquibiodomus]
MDLGLKNKRALVLGASRGLGAAIAQGLAKEGATVVAAARSRDKIEAWARDLPAGAGSVEAHELDLSDHAAIDDLADRLLADGGVDILVNNTGGPPPSTAVDARRSDWIANFETMAANIFHLTGRLLPAMRERKWGRILTVTSSGVEQPIPVLALSNGIRSAIVGWSKTLATEVARDGVTVNILMPGRIHTQRVVELDTAAASRSGKPVEEVSAAAAETIPMGRYGDPEEFANMAVFLASERASYVTGTKVRIDGGATRSV